MNSDRLIILPGDPLFAPTLAGTLPPAEQGAAFVEDANGLLKPLTSWKELQEYMYGGEYDEIDKNINAFDLE